MAPPTKDPIQDHEVDDAVLYFFDLARRWLRMPPDARTDEMTRILSAVVVAARRDSSARDAEFALRLTAEVEEHYEAVRGASPPDDAGRLRAVRTILERYQLGATDRRRIDALNASPAAIVEATGPVEAARTRVGKALGLSASTIRNFRDRLEGTGPFRDATSTEDAVATWTFRWRRALRAGRAVHDLLIRELNVPAHEVRRAMIAILRRRKGPAPL